MSFLSSAFSGASNNYNPMGTTQALNNYNSANAGLSDLATQLQQESQGNGPNLANQLLQNATGQNVANQASLMAGQRGASQNVGLMARNIAQQGAGIQQNAVGQAAANRLQEQLSAQGQLGNVLGTQGSLGANILNANNSISANEASQNAKMNQGLIGGLGGALLGGLTSASSSQSPNVKGNSAGGPANYAQFLAADGGAVPSNPILKEDFASNFVNNITPTRRFARGGQALPFAPMDLKQGGNVKARNPQEKAVKSGNSYANDKIPAMLSEGEVVIPREVMQSPDAPGAAANFVAQVMAGKHKAKKR